MTDIFPILLMLTFMILVCIVFGQSEQIDKMDKMLKDLDHQLYGKNDDIRRLQHDIDNLERMIK
jgi:hypothetical protein